MAFEWARVAKKAISPSTKSHDIKEELRIQIRHGYRYLLRAATYLQDSLAREYMHHYIVGRFRDVRASSTASTITQRLRQVRQSKQLLNRAINGHSDAVKRVLLLTYARAGKRRRQLLSEMLGNDGTGLPENDDALQDSIDAFSKTLQDDYIPGRALSTEEDPKTAVRKPIPKFPDSSSHSRQDRYLAPTSKLFALMKSQSTNHPIETDRKKIGHLIPQIPKENIWKRPMPQRRIKTIKRRFWAETFDKVLPPLPAHEWERLRGLSRGLIPLESHPPRRSRGTGVKETPTEGERRADLIRQLVNPTRITASEGIRLDWTGNGVEPVKEEQHVEKYTMSDRSLRRLYASIWSMTPLMTQDEATKEWKIIWGSQRSAAYSGEITQPSASDAELFEGVTGTPKIVTGRKTKSKKAVGK
ncbi:hypothetical protein B7494_g98 [Chlorociboria aeruginascens]|nr:hypothetical protein B7494_g98 [Chlorociboria aeruginascens]